jgi:hypothetical protein
MNLQGHGRFTTNKFMHVARNQNYELCIQDSVYCVDGTSGCFSLSSLSLSTLCVRYFEIAYGPHVLITGRGENVVYREDQCNGRINRMELWNCHKRFPKISNKINLWRASETNKFYTICGENEKFIGR